MKQLKSVRNQAGSVQYQGLIVHIVTFIQGLAKKVLGCSRLAFGYGGFGTLRVRGPNRSRQRNVRGFIAKPLICTQPLPRIICGAV
jgi:hypothetical protein